MKSQRKAKKNRKSLGTPSLRLGVLITVLSLIVAAAALLMVPAFNVTEVYCEGAVNISSEEIIAASRIETGRNILLCNIGRAEREAEKFPIVKDASVRRIFPDKIRITITERTPAAYLATGTDCAAIDTEGIVLAIIPPPLSEMIIDSSDPEYEREFSAQAEQAANTETEEENTSSQTQEDNSTHTESAEDAEPETEAAAEKPYSVPLLYGIDARSAEVGKHIKVKDADKFDELLSVLNALNDAGLLSRATYIDAENLSDLRLIIENRLDIYLGSTENISYRADFLAEVINTKISSFENVIMDYRGDDIYVRPHDDGKERFIPDETEDAAEEDEENPAVDDEEDIAEEETEDTPPPPADMTLD